MIIKCKVVKKGELKDGWRCDWCKEEFVPVHATRACYHVLKKTNLGIAVCKAAVPAAYQECYTNLLNKGKGSKNAIKQAREISEVTVVERQEVSLKSSEGSLLTSRGRSSILGYTTTKKRKEPPITGNPLANQPSIDASITNYHQSDIRKSNNAKLQMAIADLWHCENFPDRSVESIRFALVIKYARLVGSDFRIPNRKDIGGPLLKLNYETCYDQNKIDLMKEVSPFVCV